MSSPGSDNSTPCRPTKVPGPLGRMITLEALPPADTRRWVTRRKAEVVAAVAGGLLTLEEACARYALTAEEFGSWQSLIAAHGVRGLRVTRLKDYRDIPDPKPDRNGHPEAETVGSGQEAQTVGASTG